MSSVRLLNLGSGMLAMSHGIYGFFGLHPRSFQIETVVRLFRDSDLVSVGPSPQFRVEGDV